MHYKTQHILLVHTLLFRGYKNSDWKVKKNVPDAPTVSEHTPIANVCSRTSWLKECQIKTASLKEFFIR